MVHATDRGASERTVGVDFHRRSLKFKDLRLLETRYKKLNSEGFPVAQKDKVMLSIGPSHGKGQQLDEKASAADPACMEFNPVRADWTKRQEESVSFPVK